ncbi:MAG: TetR/AcrR family transcriptional regulator [Elusimicrobia bacterium]|nr:TetR/AcrR family transcriptional regulator [Elusimicrobiota bacterium]
MKPSTDAPTKTAANRGRILKAAAGLFRRQGFHGTSTREIADRAGVSLGNIYNHFPTKEKLFATLLAEYEREYFSADAPLAKVFTSARFPDNIEELGRASKETVERFGDYMRLIYVDMVEFDAKHIARIFLAMRERYQRVQLAAGTKVAKDVDPVAAMMMVTFGYFNFFIMENLFKVKGHYGMSEEDAIQFFGRVYRRGVMPQKD